MLISVIVPVFNVFDTLEQTVKSLTSQDYKDIEIVLVDDGSTDGSGALADRLSETDSRIQVIHQPHGGISSARYAGLHQATGEYFAFLEGGHRFTKNIFSEFIRAYADVKPDTFIFNQGHQKGESFEQLEGMNAIFHQPEKWMEALFHYSGVGLALANKLFHRDLLKYVQPKDAKVDDAHNMTYNLLKAAKTVMIIDTVGVIIDEHLHPLRQRFTIEVMDRVEDRLELLDQVKQDFATLVDDTADYLLDGLLEAGYQLALAKGKLDKNFKNYDKQLRIYHDAHKKLLTGDHIAWQKRAAYVLYCQSPTLYTKLYPSLRDKA
ncbi:glycosyltransferase family 2 protein [Aerococcus vaginalis]